jgi:hypothetical protein
MLARSFNKKSCYDCQRILNNKLTKIRLEKAKLKIWFSKISDGDLYKEAMRRGIL